MGDELNKWSTFPICCFLIGIILLISLLPASFQRVGALEVGIYYDTGAVHLDETAQYGPGYWYVGPGSKFLMYPLTQQTLQFYDKSVNATQIFPTDNAFQQPMITARSQDGQKITMDVFVTYSIGVSTDGGTKAAQIVEIYNSFKDNYKRPAAFQVESACLEIMSTYTATEVFTKRAEISTKIATKITSYFVSINLKFHVVSIMNMNMPAAYSEAVQNTQIASQGVEEKTNLKNGIAVSQTTNELLAVIEKNILVERATALGTIYVTHQTQIGKGLSSRYTSLNTAYTAVKTSGLTINDNLAWKFQYVHYIMAFKQSTPPSKNLIYKNVAGLKASITAS